MLVHIGVEVDNLSAEKIESLSEIYQLIKVRADKEDATGKFINILTMNFSFSIV